MYTNNACPAMHGSYVMCDLIVYGPVSFYSKKLDKHQQNYSVVEKEALSLLSAL